MKMLIGLLAALSISLQPTTATAQTAVTPITPVTATMLYPHLGTVPVANVSQIAVGATQQMALYARMGDDTNPIKTATSWASLNPTVCSVSAAGIVTGIATGSCTIQANSNSDKFTLVIVKPAVLKSLAISPAISLSTSGEPLTLVGAYSDGSTRQISSAGAAWLSSNTKVATVSGTGVTAPVGLGVTIVTATLDGIESSPAGVVVAAASLAKNSGSPVALGALMQSLAAGTYTVVIGTDGSITIIR